MEWRKHLWLLGCKDFVEDFVGVQNYVEGGYTTSFWVALSMALVSRQVYRNMEGEEEIIDYSSEPL